MKITTKTGDNGSTGLGDGRRVLKSSRRIDAIGEIDELNCNIGLALRRITPMRHGCLLLRDVQHKLFELGSELSVPGNAIITEEDVNALENDADIINQQLAPLNKFIIPKGSEVACRLHLARAVCRRAERSLWCLFFDEDKTINQWSIRYLNRLSDFLFVMARQEHPVHPELWDPNDQAEIDINYDND